MVAWEDHASGKLPSTLSAHPAAEIKLGPVAPPGLIFFSPPTNFSKFPRPLCYA